MGAPPGPSTAVTAPPLAPPQQPLAPAPPSPAKRHATTDGGPQDLLPVLARLEGLRRDVRRLDLSRLTHREALRAGAARLSAECHAALADARRGGGGSGGGGGDGGLIVCP